MEQAPTLQHRRPFRPDTDKPVEPLRDWLTPTEVALRWGVSKPTVRTWFSGKGRTPFAPSAIQTLSPGQRRLLTDGLDRTRIPPVVIVRINHLLTPNPPNRTVILAHLQKGRAACLGCRIGLTSPGIEPENTTAKPPPGFNRRP